MSLPAPPKGYDAADQRNTRDLISQADNKNHKKGQDIEVGRNARIVLIDTVTSARTAITVASGALVITPL